jgi:hypothetical protein
MMNEELAVAAAWWANEIRTLSKQDIGANELTMFYTLLQPSKAAREGITEEQLTVFRDTLHEAAAVAFLKSWYPNEPKRGLRVLSVDYHPEGPLETALDAAGIDEDFLPKKTLMWVDPGLVRVRRGYGAPIEEIYNAEKIRQEQVATSCLHAADGSASADSI